MTALVAVHDLTRDFAPRQSLISRVTQRSLSPFRAVDHVSFTIAKGETFAIVGGSGSGKTTVARMVVGLLAPTEGSVTIDGIEMTGVSAASERTALRRRIQMVFQDPYGSLNPRWRVSQTIAEPLRAFGLRERKSDIRDRVTELLTMVGLHRDDGAKFPHQFSGGQRQRVAIARALASDPVFIVCDEPTSALDVSVQAQVLNLMRDLQDRLGLSYLFISHNLAVVRHMADRVAVMNTGQIVETAVADELFAHPQHAVTRALLSSIAGQHRRQE